MDKKDVWKGERGQKGTAHGLWSQTERWVQMPAL